ncbi:segregation and condensation protein A [Thalassotalea insulae]|uniref:Segregation and condensation protein A n=1 Tax=Thalassotalea insulae TaxID=2056778 RepID=A0ABQ6GXC2_9GAMM|nr:segregation/condensation protein A [Thalassotalea insulae]GLX79839.1 segregation and condensation protein A [Thalassotalea insulae]
MAKRAIIETKQLGEMKQLPLAFVRGEAVVEKPQDLFIPPDALEVILESFEGPLDLLLYLIKKQKFDILDLPIAPITTQYMHYVELMKDLNMELAADYLVMAAILAEIKSRLLLPKQNVVEEEDDPRAELVRRLQEYEVIKQAAVDLDELPRMERDLISVQVGLPLGYVNQLNYADVELTDLVQALQQVLKRSKAYQHHHIEKESLSTRERMSNIIDQLSSLASGCFVNFVELFKPAEGRHGVVVTFLALLELIKENIIECSHIINEQDDSPAQIRVRLKEALHVID